MNISNLLATIDAHWMIDATFYRAVEQTMDAERWSAWCMQQARPPIRLGMPAQTSPEQMLRQINEVRAAASLVLPSKLEVVSASSFVSDDGTVLPYELVGGVAILEVEGPLTKRPTWMSYYYGGTATMDLMLALMQAIRDPNVLSILLRFDSPGGQVSGTFELADFVANGRVLKPIVGYISDMCASAAYAIGSQCTALVANRTALVGSIGTYMVVRDLSAMYDAAGIKTYVINAGDFKGMGTPGTEITPAQQAEFKRVVTALNAEFLSTVAKGRSFDEETLAGLADGRVHVGEAAVELGLVDRIASFDDCLTQLQTMNQSRQPVW